MSEKDVYELIESFRKSWCTTGGRKLALKSQGETEARIDAYEHSYAPSTKRALKLSKGTNAQIIKKDEEFKGHFVQSLLVFLNADESFDFEHWERELAGYIRRAFHDAGITDYTYGNAQKWINMAIKYLISANDIDPLSCCFKICYIPIDRNVLKKAHKLLGIDYLHINGQITNQIPSWSQCDNMDDIVDFENRVREATDRLGYYSPLIWEIENWNK